MGPRDEDPMKLVRSLIRRTSALLSAFICWRAIKIALGGVIVACIAIGYYFYLDSLYLVDEVYEGDKLRELNIEEKFTIRVQIPSNDKKQLKTFILHYSICQHVDEIRVLWGDESNKPPAKSFPYSKTHSRVSYEYPKDESIVPLKTDAVLYLDADVFLPCSKVAFAHNVWRSASDGVVGFFPRLYRPTSSPHNKFELLSPLFVWGSGAYSIMLGAGAFVHKKYSYENLVPLPETVTATSTSNGDTGKLKSALQTYLKSHPECVGLALPLWAAKLGADRPTWVEASSTITYKATPRFKKELAKITAGSPRQRDACLTDILVLLQIETPLPHSKHKSTRASRHIFW